MFWSFPFLGMLALGLFVHIQDASSAGDIFGTSVYPRTYLMLESLQGMYSIVLLLVVVLYSGDLIWKERSLELNEVVDSMPTPNGVYFGAKLTASLLVIVAYLLVGVLALIGYQLSRGHLQLEPGPVRAGHRDCRCVSDADDGARVFLPCRGAVFGADGDGSRVRATGRAARAGVRARVVSARPQWRARRGAAARARGAAGVRVLPQGCPGDVCAAGRCG